MTVLPALPSTWSRRFAFAGIALFALLTVISAGKAEGATQDASLVDMGVNSAPTETIGTDEFCLDYQQPLSRIEHQLRSPDPSDGFQQSYCWSLICRSEVIAPGILITVCYWVSYPC